MSKGFYDFGDYNDTSLLKSCDLDDLLWMKNLSVRKIYWNMDIDESVFDNIVQPILKYNEEDKDIPAENRKPIYLYLSSYGGEVFSGFQVIDAIKQSKTPVYIICFGCCYSMAALIFIAGHKRFASENATFLIHDGTQMMVDSSTKLQDRMEFNRQLEKTVKSHVLRSTKISEQEYDKNLRVEWYMLAKDAKEKGIVDYIIGEDCELDDVM